MKMTWVLYVKEIKSLFSSWVAYVVLIAFTLLCGLYFNVALQMFEIMTRYSDSIEEGAARQSWNLLEYLVGPLYDTIFILLFVMVRPSMITSASTVLTSKITLSIMVAATTSGSSGLMLLRVMPLSIKMICGYGYPGYGGS